MAAAAAGVPAARVAPTELLVAHFQGNKGTHFPIYASRRADSEWDEHLSKQYMENIFYYSPMGRRFTTTNSTRRTFFIPRRKVDSE